MNILLHIFLGCWYIHIVGINLGEWLSHGVCICLALEDTAKQFFKLVIPDYSLDYSPDYSIWDFLLLHTHTNTQNCQLKLNFTYLIGKWLILIWDFNFACPILHLFVNLLPIKYLLLWSDCSIIFFHFECAICDIVLV